MTENPTELVNKVMWSIPNALALVGSRADDEWNAMTTSWITQVAMEPVLVGVGIDKKAVTHRLIEAGGSFSINLWSADDTRTFVKFSKPARKDGMTLNGRAIRAGASGAPIFEEAVAWIDLKVWKAVDCGTHTFFIGEVVDVGLADPEATVASISDTRMKYGGVRRGGH
ncbi:MAG: flavin reductase family protein [Acidimicrobiia bacterium]|nr:flavin reductase family protein [Acidimicrobiia bacterium]